MADPVIIRASALSGYPDCPRRGAARLFWREIEAAGFKLRRTLRGIGAAIGTANHKSASTTLEEKAQSGKLPPLSIAMDVAVSALHDELGEGEIRFDNSTYNARQAEAQTIAMSSGYHRIVAPQVEPIAAIEQRFEAEVEPGIILSGQPDVVAHEPGRIRDLKTGARRPRSNAPQLGAYALLARTHGYNIESAAIDFVQRVAIDRPQPDPITRPVPVGSAETAAASIIKHISNDIKTFRHGDAERRILPGDAWSFLANPSSFLCSEKYCPCWGVTGPHSFCHEWQPK